MDHRQYPVRGAGDIRGYTLHVKHDVDVYYLMLISNIDNLYFKSVIILHSKHKLPWLLADYKITI